MLAANVVTLGVLAPISYYHNSDLTKLVFTLNDGLEEFGEQNSVALHFEFCKFAVDYASDLEPEQVRSAIEVRRRIWVSERR